MDFRSGLSAFPLDFANAAFLFALLTWVLVQTWRSGEKDGGVDERYVVVGEFSLSRKIMVLCNATVSIMHLGFGVSSYYEDGVFRWGSAIVTLTWVSATVAASWSRRSLTMEEKPWPLVLVLWWAFAFVLDSASVFVFMVAHSRRIKLPEFFPEARIVDFVSLPLSAVLCFNGLHTSFRRRFTDLKHPLLEEEEESSSKLAANSYFTNAGIWSHLTFGWLNPLFRTGRAQKLELHHVPPVPESETAENASMLLECSLRKQKAGDFSLTEGMYCFLWKSLIINAVFAGFCTFASYIGPFLITNFVNFLSEKSETTSYFHGLVLACIFFLAKTVESLSQRQWYFGANRIGVRVKAALTELIYRKSLSMKFVGLSNGKIINLVNVDVERVGDFCLYIHGVWLLPVQLFLALVLLYWNLGATPSMAALLSTVLVMVSNTPLVSKQKSFHSKIMEAKDSRIKATSETLKTMRVLKLHSWETRFMERILNLRETEQSWLRKYLYTCSAVAFLFWASPTLVSVITFGLCIMIKTPLTSGTVLSALATFRILQEPIYNLPELVSMVAQTKVSIDRIQEFLGGEDRAKQMPSSDSHISDAAIEIGIGEYAWETSNQNLKKPTVRITDRIKVLRGQKVAVCGSVGSGKSSLLCSILGEIPKISGSAVKVYGSKAYVPQGPWIQSGTVRENVLFGKKFDWALYEEVLEGCALDHDIRSWLDKDCSLIGERGMNLSGGQKQRIQLARAIYSDADVYILDDPFSAVDAHTGTHLFKNCLKKLLSTKTVVYATHQLEFLTAADLVLVMKDGNIVQSGKYEDLIADQDGELVRQMNAHRKSINTVNPLQEDNSLKLNPCHLNPTEVIEEKYASPDNTCKAKIQEEDTATGRVKWSVYSRFVTAAFRGALVPVVLMCQVLFQGLQMASNYWIAWATEDQHHVSKGNLIGIFVLLAGGSSFFILARAVLLTCIAIETSQRLFLGMIKSVFRAPILFFDSTPSSRILYRSSTDQSTVDTDIPYRLAGLAFALIQLLSIIILMSQVAWQVFPLFLAILGISAWYQAYYITTARELARMVAIRKVPILHHFSESIMGAPTIRCFSREDRFILKDLDLIDDYSRVAFYNSGTMEWLSVRINFLFNFVFFLLLVILVTLPRRAIDPSLAGLAATYGLNLNVLQAWVIWNMCNVENKMISVERILQLTNIPSEAPLVINDSRPEPEWPKYGRIELQNVLVQYGPELPMVLKGITCTFPGEKKIGVVGRTGSGKSTLIQALFRVVELSGGCITIDGLDISKIGLQDLRSKLGIIPQDPTLFQGTVRTNLDPLQQHSDHDIWEVLRKCHLADIVKEYQRSLDAPVAEDGENWSVGQRQLVCLARVLLKKRRILVLDEATASIDTATDSVIQETITEETSQCTVLTVAHRIATIIDNDLVLVLDDGKVIEYDSPRKLLEDNSSAFSKLVAEFVRRASKTNHPRNDLDIL